MQMAFIEVTEAAPKLGPVPEVCATEAGIQLFAKLLQGAPRLLETLTVGGPFTVFAPTDAAIR